MTDLDTSAPTKDKPQRSKSNSVGWGLLGKLKRNGFPFASAAIILLLLIVPALFAPWIAPHDPFAGGLTQRLRPPVGFGGEWEHVLGTDRVGRDIFSRIIHGARITSYVAIVGILFSATIGVVAGLLAGYFGKWVDTISMRFVDMTLAFPAILLAIFLAVMIGPSFFSVQIVIAFILWAFFARQVRGEVLSIMREDFISLAKINGVGNIRIMLQHLLPNVANTIIVLATLNIGYVIILESSLSFLGIGLPPPTPSWGLMVADGRALIVSSWWVALFPGLVITAVVLASNSLGDWMSKNLDPRVQKVA